MRVNREKKGDVGANLTKIEKTPFDERRNLCDANDRTWWRKPPRSKL